MSYYYIWTIGCQMNKAESERLGSFFEQRGYQATATADKADIIVVNSCVVRQSAENRVINKLGALKSLKRLRPCLTLAVTAKDRNIMTIEGLAQGHTLHPLQQAFIDNGAVQCGFCTPGMILNAKFLLDENPDPSADEIKTALAGNLCRCTGYVKIVDAVLDAAKTMKKGGKR